MRSLSSWGLGLSVVFGCLLLALMAETYYLLWWKRRWNSRREVDQDDYNKLCWNRKSSSSTADPQPQMLKQFNENGTEMEMEMELELQLVVGEGPPRFLFTIKEETEEELECEDAKSTGGDHYHQRARTRNSLSDQMPNNAEPETERTPYLTPESSPQFFTPLPTPITLLGNYSSHYSPSGSGSGYNPFLESSTDAEFNRIRASPPPVFKFLRDAEEKLDKKKREEAAEKLLNQRVGVGVGAPFPCNGASTVYNHAADGSFLVAMEFEQREIQIENPPHIINIVSWSRDG
ncbi:hypothetical protein Dimus_011337 [Dionaea muscipula]